MGVLQNVSSIDQKMVKYMYRFAIRNSQNLFILGPSGCGKSEIAIQAIEEEGAQYIYWNLSVTERPDIQGIPRVSDDGLVTKYAAPEKLPFMDIRSRIVRNAADCFAVGSEERMHLDKLASKFDKYQTRSSIESALRYVDDSIIKYCLEKKLYDLDQELLSMGCPNVVILFDEVEKAPPECLQPLLELLQFRSINQRMLCIKSCILTGNLPDEHTHSEPLSHAITNRGMVFQLEPSFNVWQQWALKNNVHPLITGFLTYEENQEFFLKRPKNNQIYNYSYPTPRGWTATSNLLYAYEEDKMFWIGQGVEEKTFIRNLIESKVGVDAATRLSVWYEYYQALEPTISAAFNGEDPKIEDKSVDEQLVALIGVNSRFVSWCRKNANDIPLVHRKVEQIFPWINKFNPDLKIAALRGTCDVDLFISLELHKHPITSVIWHEIVKLSNDKSDEEEQEAAKDESKAA